MKGGSPSTSGSTASADVGVEVGDGEGSGVEDGQELPAALPTLPNTSVSTKRIGRYILDRSVIDTVKFVINALEKYNYLRFKSLNF